MGEDVWQALTKTALRLMTGPPSKRVDVDAVTNAAIAAHSHLPNVEQHRDRLRAFVRDMVGGDKPRR